AELHCNLVAHDFSLNCVEWNFKLGAVEHHDPIGLLIGTEI
ncbi:MAG: hypothetical protein JWR39_1056, partial [Devosia sp.]|nr:hypothetical protein [Devosia sp.]